MHQQKLIDRMGGAHRDERGGQILRGGPVILQNDDTVIVAVGAEEPQQQLCVLFCRPIECRHCPAG